MFTKTGINAVKSSEGYSVARTGRMEITYTDLGRSLVVEVEPGDGLAIYSKSIVRWDSRESGEPLSIEEKEKIIKNIGDALSFMGVQFFFL